MRTKYFLLPALLLLTSGALQAVDFTWAGHGTISFELPAGWKMEGQPAEDVGYTFAARPDAGVAAFLQITLVSIPADKPIAVAELPERLHASLLPYIEQSVEKEFRPVSLKSSHGKGWYAELTDAALVGKPPLPDDFKVMRSALIAVDRQTLVIATMQFDEPGTNTPAEMLAIVSSVRFDRVPAAESSSLK
jgi:hypothetical protein